jgi:hypothetical protein
MRKVKIIAGKTISSNKPWAYFKPPNEAKIGDKFNLKNGTVVNNIYIPNNTIFTVMESRNHGIIALTDQLTCVSSDKINESQNPEEILKKYFEEIG